MNYRLSDEEYAVLNYIRTNNGTHIDHLKIVFGPESVPAVKNLEDCALIAPDFPNRDIYHATTLGKAYKHEDVETRLLNVEHDKNAPTHEPDNKQTKNKTEDNSPKRNLPLIIWREIKSFILDVLRIILRKE